MSRPPRTRSGKSRTSSWKPSGKANKEGNYIDDRPLAGAYPQPGVEAPDPPARFIGMDDVALPPRFEEQFAGGSGKIRHALRGTNEDGGARVI
jgi:hypothetical protein